MNLSLLTKSSCEKIIDLDFPKNIETIVSNNLSALVDNMLIASKKQIILTHYEPDIYLLKNVFINFDENLNNVFDSKFQHDVKLMTEVYGFKMNINDQIININILTTNNKKGYVVALIHAINTFCHMFPYEYHGLTMYICLDDNTRNIDFDPSNYSLDDMFKRLHKESGAFNVSGMTQRSSKKIVLTKSEEIVKLMFHEMVHYIGLDQKLLSINKSYNWNLINQRLNISEAYTEFLSVLLNSSYEAIYFMVSTDSNVHNTFQKILSKETTYSVWLSSYILKLYGYNSHNLHEFFSGQNLQPKYSPIPSWEYIILRTQLLLNINEMNEFFPENLKINNLNLDKFLSLIEINNDFIELIKSFIFSITNLRKNISYNLIDINWNCLLV
ncbi:hypothetical protein qu_221 [Acanthamoeba polyphaga mimivirus]|nr:hypothetical protein [Mimivirus reunion]WMV61559.1 hypothetical protein qu_221 [Mimivirus sp.]WMV62536.1 hypothetical protein qu_221 [Acanthamoeba polyphaga mimivirus]WMV63513.1 hypothetical protein qu_221 [Mimivirus sp.]